MNDEKLIEAVRCFPCLWQVGEGCTAEGCTRRWKALRGRFVRELKKTKTKTGQAGPVFISCWPLFNVLSFITDTVRHKSPVAGDILVQDSDGNTEESESYTQEESCASTSCTPARSMSPQLAPSPAQHPPKGSSRKRKRQEQIDEVDEVLLSRLDKIQTEKEQDEEGAFCASLASRLRRFSRRQKAIIYLEINKLLLNIEFPSDPYLCDTHPRYPSFSQQPYPPPSQPPPEYPPQHSPQNTSTLYDY